MNKTQLLSELQKPEAQLNSLLSAAGIQTDLEDYTTEHLETIQAINELVESGDAKTYEEAQVLRSQQQQQADDATSQKAAQPLNNLEEFILSLANQAADTTFASFPSMALEEHHRLKALFVQQYRLRILERLQDPEFQQQFQAAMSGQDLGKLKLLLSSTKSSTALLGSSSSSN